MSNKEHDAAAEIKKMVDALLHVSIYFRFEAWERDLTDEEKDISEEVDAALDNPLGRAARDALRQAIARDAARALMEEIE